MRKRQRYPHLQPVPPFQPPDDLETINVLILACQDALHEAIGCEDFKEVTKLVDTLIALLSYRRKIDPPTVAELAEMAIALGATPETFMKQLATAWNR